MYVGFTLFGIGIILQWSNQVRDSSEFSLLTYFTPELLVRSKATKPGPYSRHLYYFNTLCWQGHSRPLVQTQIVMRVMVAPVSGAGASHKVMIVRTLAN